MALKLRRGRRGRGGPASEVANRCWR